MFLEKMMSFTGMRAGDKIMDTRAFSAYNTVHNKTRVTEFRYKSGTSFRAASALSDAKHINILRCMKIDAKRRTIVTEQVFPFRDAFSASEGRFNQHCAYALASALHFLHTECMLGHNNVSLETLFITQNLNIVLGSFDMCEKNAFQKDLDDFKGILRTFNLPYVPVRKVVDDKEWFSPFLDTIEVFVLEIPVLGVTEKHASIARLAENKEVLGRFMREKVSEILVVELHRLRAEQSDPDTLQLKHALLELALELGRTRSTLLYDLLVVLDPSVRLYLLSSPTVLDTSSLDNKAVESILLGIKCKDYGLQLATIRFVSQYYARLTEKQRIGFVKAATFLSDKRLLTRVCPILLASSDAGPAFRREVCKLIVAFLPVEGLRGEVLPLMKTYYKDFEFSEICGKVIFLLFELVRCKDSQKSAFELIDLLVQHLKRNSDAVIEKNWCVSDLTTLFFTKKKDTHADAADDAAWSEGLKAPKNTASSEGGWDEEW